MPGANEDVIELLEVYLETARKHPFGSIAIVMTGHPNIAATDFAGEVALELSTMEALGAVARKLKESIYNWSLPDKNPELDASHVCYNIANGPLSFDFLVWLVDAEMTRLREGCEAPLKVGFWLGQNKSPTTNQVAWLNKVFRPSLALIGAIEDDSAVFGRTKTIFTPRDIVTAVKAGEPIPFFKAPVFSPSNRSPFPGAVTITLREIKDNTGRNSNLPAWERFARKLCLEGESVVFVRDTAKAHEPFKEFATCPAASINIWNRMALYQEARANLFVSNGPATLAHFSDRPWLEFITVDAPRHADDIVNTTAFWTKNMGIVPGEQWPWSRFDQRIIWKPDSYENLVEAWQALNLPSLDKSLEIKTGAF